MEEDGINSARKIKTRNNAKRIKAKRIFIIIIIINKDLLSATI